MIIQLAAGGALAPLSRTATEDEEVNAPPSVPAGLGLGTLGISSRWLDPEPDEEAQDAIDAGKVLLLPYDQGNFLELLRAK